MSTKTKKIAARAQCQVCGHVQALTADNLLVEHGYRRPGWGYNVGRCSGVMELPYELSCERVKSWITTLQGFLTNAQGDRARLVVTRTLTVHIRDRANRMGIHGKIPRTSIEITPETENLIAVTDGQFYRFEDARRVAIAQVDSIIRALQADIKEQTRRVEVWVLAPEKIIPARTETCPELTATERRVLTRFLSDAPLIYRSERATVARLTARGFLAAAILTESGRAALRKA